MYFKRISMHGFKSFADPTTVNLELGITAIVGPNGCGKSNILDALRWALGEQSVKELRGTHMQDVIFNGSVTRPPMGMAEVTLTFDNSDGQLPVEFNEVEITRRVYRSGESEYLLNKSACRLRDIQELFMDTGIGANAYSLIGQGKIDLVLSTKPEDRRYLIEEAAGIIKYKTRKRMALRKLESADQNMLRLNDIIAEVDRQMRALKRQVNAAIRYREISDELRELEIRNAWLKYNELSGQIDDLKKRLRQAVDLYQEASTKMSRQEADLEAFNLKRIELDQQIAQRREKEHATDTELERLESQFALYKKECDFARERCAEAVAEHERLIQQARKLGGESDTTKNKFAEREKEVHVIRHLLAEKQTRLESVREELAHQEAEMEQLRSIHLESANTQSRAQTELETIGQAMQALQNQFEAAQEQHNALLAKLAEAQKQLGETSSSEDEIRRSLIATSTQKERNQKDLLTIQESIAQLNQEWQRLREYRSSLDARLTSLIELRDSYEGFAAGVRTIMAAKQKRIQDLSGILGPVGDIVSIEKCYEYALEAALGGNINNVVVETADDAKSAIQFLKETRAGRVTFLPLDTIRPGTMDETVALSKRKGVIGPLIHYVLCESRVLPAIQYLLYNTLLVESLDDAISIARKETNFPRLVTLEGEVVTSAGAVTGGRTQRDTHGLLGRSAEIEELTQKVNATQHDIEVLVSRAQELNNQLSKGTKTQKMLEAEELYLRSRLNEIEVTGARQKAEKENLEKSFSSIMAMSEMLEKQRKDLEERLAHAQSKIGGMENSQATLNQQMEATQKRISTIREEEIYLNQEIADLRAREADVLGNLEALRRDIERSMRSSSELAEQAQKQQSLAEELEKRASVFEERAQETLRTAAELSKTRDKLHEEVVETQREQQFVLESVEKLTQHVKESRTKTDAAQREVHKLELECSQKEERIRYFQERISIEYGLALASLTEETVGTDTYDEKEREALIEDHRKSLQRLGVVNLGAIEEYDALEKRAKFLKAQNDDLVKARDTLLGVIKRIDATTQDMFLSTFEAISENFKNHFRRLFNGGQARLYLLDESNPLECGIEIEARPPGKKPQTIKLLSGGEQALTAIALLFSIFSTKPSPFCVLDEVDAPLDDINIGRFLNMVEEFTERSQFVMITHNKQTMARANALFGVTQQDAGVSQIVSVRLEEAEKVAAIS